MGRVQADTWYFLELSWDVHTGFQVYINDVLRAEVAYSQHTATNTSQVQTKGRFLIGFADDPDIDQPLYGDFIVDEVELWFQDRNTLLAFGYIDRGLSATHLLNHSFCHISKHVYQSSYSGQNVHWPCWVYPGMSYFAHMSWWEDRETDMLWIWSASIYMTSHNCAIVARVSCFTCLCIALRDHDTDRLYPIIII